MSLARRQQMEKREPAYVSQRHPVEGRLIVSGPEHRPYALDHADHAAMGLLDELHATFAAGRHQQQSYVVGLCATYSTESSWGLEGRCAHALIATCPYRRADSFDLRSKRLV